MAIRIKSINDTDLLHLTGFFGTLTSNHGKLKQELNVKRLAKFHGVSARTIQRWVKDGLPRRVRTQLENLYNGQFLPPAFQDAEISIHHDGIMLRDGFHISIDTLKFWQFIVFGVDWQRVRDIERSLNTNRRLPITLTQSGLDAIQRTINNYNESGFSRITSSL